jgi:hypothetical protein
LIKKVEKTMRPGDKIMLLGYSWGGDAVYTIAKELKGLPHIPDLVWTIDPVWHPIPGLADNFPSVKGLSVKWINYYEIDDKKSLLGVHKVHGIPVTDATENNKITIAQLLVNKALIYPDEPFTRSGKIQYADTSKEKMETNVAHSMIPYYIPMLEALQAAVKGL